MKTGPGSKAKVRDLLKRNVRTRVEQGLTISGHEDVKRKLVFEALSLTAF
jgi:hypothetical protein